MNKEKKRRTEWTPWNMFDFDFVRLNVAHKRWPIEQSHEEDRMGEMDFLVLFSEWF